MTQRLERNSGTLLPIVLSCLFFVFMAASAITSLPADANAATATPAPELAEAPLEATTADAVAVEEEAALPVAMLVEPQALDHQISYTEPSDELIDREIA